MHKIVKKKTAASLKLRGVSGVSIAKNFVAIIVLIAAVSFVFGSFLNIGLMNQEIYSQGHNLLVSVFILAIFLLAISVINDRLFSLGILMVVALGALLL